MLLIYTNEPRCIHRLAICKRATERENSRYEALFVFMGYIRLGVYTT